MATSASIRSVPLYKHPKIMDRTLTDCPRQPWDLLSLEVLTGVEAHFPAARQARDKVRQKTGLVYDETMTQHKCLWNNSHDECPERCTCIIKRCCELGLVDRCVPVSSRMATEEEILNIHSEEHLNTLKSTSNCSNTKELQLVSGRFDQIYIHPSTFHVAMLAAGSAIQLVDAVLSGKVQNGMAVIRPPGHNAKRNQFSGNSFFNNIALSAHHAIRQHNLKRILIIDWDVYHGQATQQMFYNDEKVLYFSIHRYEHGSFWPHSSESDFYMIGEGRGKGFNFNVPLSDTGMTDSDYLAIFHQILLPVAYEFQPELILISSGYDVAVGSAQGGMNVTPASFSHFVSLLMGLANGKVAVVLEGGYCLKSLAEGAAMTLKGLLGDPCPIIQSEVPPSDSIQKSILNVIYVQKPYWHCFQYQELYRCAKHPKEQYFHPEVEFTRKPAVPAISSDLSALENTLDALISTVNLTIPPNRVCLVYDECMLKYKHLLVKNHPERPDRIATIYARHKEFGLLERCLLLKSRLAKEEELQLVHTPNHVSVIKETSKMDPKALFKLENETWGAYYHPDIYECALVSVGCVLQVVDSVLTGESRSGVAIVRPPGHHAEENEACGFCIFGNVALAAKYAIEIHGLKRVLIVDWDVHHGNGTQKCFYDDPRVLYISLHRYHNGFLFPFLKDSDYNNVGYGKGTGYNVNIPWCEKGMGDAEYISAFHNVILPIAYQYNPELVLISAGFDSARDDPLGECSLSPEAYGHMTQMVSSLANGKVAVVLEGGYNLTATSYSMVMCTKALLGDPVPPLDLPFIPKETACCVIRDVIRTQKQYWSCLKFHRAFPEEGVLKI